MGLMSVTYTGLEDGKMIHNIEAIKNDGENWLLYNAFTGVPTKIPARLKIVVKTQPA